MITSENLLTEALEDYKASEILSDNLMSSIMFKGRSLDQWIEHLAIDIPTEVTLDTLRDLYTLVAKRIQQVSYFMSICNTYNATLSDTANIRKAKIVNDLVLDYQSRNAKRPAAQVLDQAADSQLERANVQIIASKVLKDFWKDRRDTLVEVRKCLEQITMSHLAEMKYLPNN